MKSRIQFFVVIIGNMKTKTTDTVANALDRDRQISGTYFGKQERERKGGIKKLKNQKKNEKTKKIYVYIGGKKKEINNLKKQKKKREEKIMSRYNDFCSHHLLKHILV